ncbi:hypothetical protein [Lacipirellula parvula]|uniref:Uncharacterized protein n=1 Tax=Lacipirellula parvula TaxID=2650471 RepID=A0A5K7XI52_9BACT|nr:hypothetical protein [Lacipirellula parvula]BBO36574.1 hypothetical protein PLANPX_6186 [Lacipirellula parvula]
MALGVIALAVCFGQLGNYLVSFFSGKPYEASTARQASIDLLIGLVASALFVVALVVFGQITFLVVRFVRLRLTAAPSGKESEVVSSQESHPVYSKSSDESDWESVVASEPIRLQQRILAEARESRPAAPFRG